jgi:hypothetical protein
MCYCNVITLQVKQELVAPACCSGVGLGGEGNKDWDTLQTVACCYGRACRPDRHVHSMHPGPHVAGPLCQRRPRRPRPGHCPGRTFYRQGTCCPRCPLPRKCTVSMPCRSPSLSSMTEKVKASAPPQRSVRAGPTGGILLLIV